MVCYGMVCYANGDGVASIPTDTYVHAPIQKRKSKRGGGLKMCGVVFLNIWVLREFDYPLTNLHRRVFVLYLQVDIVHSSSAQTLDSILIQVESINSVIPDSVVAFESNESLICRSVCDVC
jgi:hypothetical protein